MSEKNLSIIEKHSSTGKFQPIYFLFGTEHFIMDEFLNVVKTSISQNGSDVQDIVTVWGNEISLGEIISMASSYPLFSDRKLIIVKDFQKIKPSSNEKKALEEFLTKPLDSTILVLLCYDSTKKDLPQQTLSFFENYAYEFPKFKSPMEFITIQFERCGKKISPEAVSLFAEYVTNDSREINNEIQKILLFIEGRPDQVVNVKDISKVVGISKDYNLFSLQSQLMNKKLRDASVIILIMMQREKGALFPIISYLSSLFIKLLKLRQTFYQTMNASILAKEIGLFGGQAYYLEQYRGYAKGFSSEKIEAVLKKLAYTDLCLKGITPQAPTEEVLALELIQEITSS